MNNRNHESQWVALLDGEEAADVRTAVQDIADAVRATPGSGLDDDGPEPPSLITARDASLAGGSAGQALLFAYLAKAYARDEDQDTLVALIEQAIDAVAEVQMTDGLYSGFPGIAWAVEHLRDQLMEPDDEDPNDGIDDAVLTRLSAPRWLGDYDLIAGLVGLGVYAVERLPRTAAVTCLESALTRLEELAEEKDVGCTWLTPPEHLPAWQLEIAPNGYYNLGLAHGVPGIIGLLAEMVAADVAPPRSRPLLDAAVAWQLAQRLPGDQSGWFDAWDNGQELSAARSAWCYGDPGVACALYKAGCHADERAWREAAVAMIRNVQHRTLEQIGVKDTGLCHGAAGLAHILNRFYQSTGDEEIAETARFWFRKTLEMRKPGEAVAGFPSYQPEPDGTPRWRADSGLLTGAAGVGLALLAAITPVEPAWDRMLLMALPMR